MSLRRDHQLSSIRRPTMLNASTFERNVDSDQELKLSFDRGLSAAIMTACNNVWGLLHGNRAVAANALLAKPLYAPKAYGGLESRRLRQKSLLKGLLENRLVLAVGADEVGRERLLPVCYRTDLCAAITCLGPDRPAQQLPLHSRHYIE